MNEQIINSLLKLDELSKNIYQYIDSNEPIDDEECLQNTINNQIDKSKSMLKIVIQMLVSIYKENDSSKIIINTKIIQLFDFLQKHIKENFSENEIFNIFKAKKRLLLYIYETKLITKQYFYQEMLNNFNDSDYLQYFFIELSELNQEEFQYRIHSYQLESFVEKESKNKELFIEQRKNGENDGKLSKMIRNDLIDDFTSLVSQSNLDLNSKIEKSLFNPIYNDSNEPSLIEYAAYCGSHNIFKYLLMNDARISKNIFWFAIHGRNYDIIHLIENQQNIISDDFFIECYNEAIKCHFNEIAVYIEESFLKEKIPFSSIETCVRSFNIQMMTRIFENDEKVLIKQTDFNKFFFYLCEYGYIDIVDLILKQTKNGILNEKDTEISIYIILMIFN